MQLRLMTKSITSLTVTLDYEYDVEAFDSHLTVLEKYEIRQERIRMFQNAVDLVHGPYLAKSMPTGPPRNAKD